MQYKQLGRTGLYVSEICLGTMTFDSKEGGFRRVVGELEQKEVDEKYPGWMFARQGATRVPKPFEPKKQ